MRTIVIQNHSTRADITEAWLNQTANTLALQAQYDVCPAYGLAPVSVLAPADTRRAALAKHGIDEDACEVLAIFDTPDQPGALGYHDKGPTGVPYGKAFAHFDGQPVALRDLRITLSHECGEMIVNPETDLIAVGSPDGVGRFREIADPVEDVTYVVDGAEVSDFVLPAWFENGAPGPYDKANKLKRPFERTEGGYVILDDGGEIVTDPPERAAAPAKAHETSRLSKTARKAKAAKAATP